MRRGSNGLSGGIIMIGIAVLLITDYWWPGIMYVVGASMAIPALINKEYSKAALAVVIFGGIPFLIFSEIKIAHLAAAVLVVVGLYSIIKRT